MSDEDDERSVIRQGRDFEQEYRLTSEDASEFLADLAAQLGDGEDLTITDEEWELPFAFGEPVKLEMDYEGVGQPTLEIEVEIPGREVDDAPQVE
jgi:amphi-Trp domain-containing protein